MESNPNAYGVLSSTVIKKCDCINFKSTVQIPESPQFQIVFSEASISVPGSFTVQSGDHFRSLDYLRYKLDLSQVDLINLTIEYVRPTLKSRSGRAKDFSESLGTNKRIRLIQRTSLKIPKNKQGN